jgi:hypothetical protein
MLYELLNFIIIFFNFACRPSSYGVANNSWRIFTYKELHTATNGFSDDYKLGEGGFGSVYWGRTSDGLQVKHKIH